MGGGDPEGDAGSWEGNKANVRRAKVGWKGRGGQGGDKCAGDRRSQQQNNI